MYVFVAFSDKSLRAVIALKFFLTGMNLFVVHQAVFELELLPTNLVWALVGLRIAKQFQIVVFGLIVGNI